MIEIMQMCGHYGMLVTITSIQTMDCLKNLMLFVLVTANEVLLGARGAVQQETNLAHIGVSVLFERLCLRARLLFISSGWDHG